MYKRFLRTSAYIKSYDSQTKSSQNLNNYNLIEDDDLLKKYNTICDNVSSDIKKNFYSKTFHNNFFFFWKFYGDEAVDSQDKEMPNVGSNHTFLSVISLNSCLMKYKNYYPQVFLKECKYI